MPRWYRRYGGFKARNLRVGYAQKKGYRSQTMAIQVENIYSISIARDAHYSTLLRCVPFKNLIGTAAENEDNVRKDAQSLLQSKLFKTYIQLYDQFKINGVRHVCGVGVSIGQGYAPACKIYTGWDRQLTAIEEESMITFDDLEAGPESTVQMFVDNSRPVVTRSCWARDLQEKTNYVDTKTFSSPNNYEVMNSFRPTQGGNTLNFHPVFYLGVNVAGTPDAAATLKVSVSSTYYVTFRGPRYGLSSGDAKFLDLAKAEIVEKKEEEEEKPKEEEPVLRKKKVTYEEETLPDDEMENDDDDEEESQAPLTQPFKSPMKKAGKKSSS